MSLVRRAMDKAIRFGHSKLVSVEWRNRAKIAREYVQRRQAEPEIVGNGLLPPGDHYALTWGFPARFGGMSTIVLQRSTMFSALDNRPVEILTLAQNFDAQKREAELREVGLLGAEAHIRNLWQDLKAWPDERLYVMAEKGNVLSSAQSDSNIEHKRPDGTLVVLEQRYEGKPKKVVFTLYEQSGKPIGVWHSESSFYQAWFEAVFCGRTSYLISDSKSGGAKIYDYQRPYVVKCQVMHNPWLSNPMGSIYGRSTWNKREVSSHLDWFDFTVPLTDRYRQDLLDAGLVTGDCITIPNPTEDLHGDTERDRPSTYGVIAARLERQKRLDHVIRAVAQCQDSDLKPHLDIYGVGNEKAKLENLVEELNATSAVSMHGYLDNAKMKFLEASFTVLSSEFDALALVLLESMSAGCIPIAYDIKYGPSNIITDGVDGFLVAPGDVDALAHAIRTVVTMPAIELRKMRRAARIRVKDYFGMQIVTRWGQILNNYTDIRKLGADNSDQKRGITASVKEMCRTDTGTVEVVVDINTKNTINTDRAVVYIEHRRRPVYFSRVQASLNGNRATAKLPLIRLDEFPEGSIDFYIDLINSRKAMRVRLKYRLAESVAVASKYSVRRTINGNTSLESKSTQGDYREE